MHDGNGCSMEALVDRVGVVAGADSHRELGHEARKAFGLGCCLGATDLYLVGASS